MRLATFFFIAWLLCEVKRSNKSAIMVTHDKRMLDLCDRVVYIEDGKLSEYKTKEYMASK